MVVNLTDAELSAGMMLTGVTGSTLDTPPEPILGRIQRFLAVATAIINVRIPTAPRGHSERVRDQALNLLVQPTTGGPNVGLRQRLGQLGMWHGRCRLDATPVGEGALTLHLRDLLPSHGTSLTWNGPAGC